ncbi:hypothetical protein CHS0354_015775, partial [Potamilus streckersoni]
MPVSLLQREFPGSKILVEYSLENSQYGYASGLSRMFISSQLAQGLIHVLKTHFLTVGTGFNPCVENSFPHSRHR